MTFSECATECEALIMTAYNLLANIIDAGQYGPGRGDVDPESHSDWPRDEDGDVWFPDVWELREAASALDAKRADGQEKTEDSEDDN